MAVPIETTGETLELGKPVELFKSEGWALRRRFDLAPDGQRLLVLEPTEQADVVSPISVLVNWPAVLAERQHP